MKKTLFAAILLAGASVAYADWYWQGGDQITSENWQVLSNWNSSASGDGNAPTVTPGWPDSNNWDAIRISNASGSVGTLEGWAMKLYLTNSDLNITAKKLQGGDPGCVFDIDQSSSLTYTCTANNFQGAKNISVAGSLTMNFDGGVSTDARLIGAWNITLSGNGTATMTRTSGTGGSLGDLTLNLTGSNLVDLSQFSLDSSAGSFSVVSTKVITLGNGVNFSRTMSLADGSTVDGLSLTKAEGDLIANAENVGKYTLTQEADGVYLNCVVAVPEPATATLSLLALAGLCARRRRK